MQSVDDKGNIIGLDRLDPDLTELVPKVLEREQEGAVTFRIGRLPPKGHQFEMLGMLYEVVSFDNKKGTFKARLVRPG